MTWWKVDDALHSHPKWLATPPAARGLWVTAGSWCASHLTDGFVPASSLPTFNARRRDAAALVKSGLWEVVEGGWQFHGFHEYQPSKDEVEAARAAARERMRKRRANGVRPNVGSTSHSPTRPDPTLTTYISSSPKESAPQPGEDEELRQEARRRLRARDAISTEPVTDRDAWLARCVAQLRDMGWTPPAPLYPDATAWLEEHRAITPSPPPEGWRGKGQA